MNLLAITLEIEKEKEELRVLGLSEIEIEGYIEFFIDNWFPEVSNDIRVRMSTVWTYTRDMA